VAAAGSGEGIDLPIQESGSCSSSGRNIRRETMLADYFIPLRFRLSALSSKFLYKCAKV